ncbi:MAG: DEAD/DEAH box helicase [Lentisphaerae bacterium]|nr:DEAD/DEAH box helicase [Lentisphaerota bacterium]MBT5605365.1 DEAD/DEAH box helicase [Lentisphaerota bacterium]MBT7060370.1 DEAD/DEAH box helicase [Lentisphaerota bacterium]MBT7844776.1 DEAD/DEAH box helicase [Lentisphaerota bacterium]
MSSPNTNEKDLPGADPLAPFHPLVSDWFLRELGPPTPVQAAAWPHISDRKHVLITAPTGSGKTLTAFLWGLNQFLAGNWACGQTRILYVSPLKALNNDIQRNLISPLNGLRHSFTQAGEPFPDIHVLTRSGDTPGAERRRMERHPPEILITTPESLNLLLAAKGGRRILATVETVILDEIHAVISSKRGVHLMTAVERLVRLAGEFQRIAVSATVNPLQTVADVVGGYVYDRAGHLQPRPVTIVQTPQTKRYDITIDFPLSLGDIPPEGGIWPILADELRETIRANRSTLIFARTRSLCEQLTQLINADEPTPLAYAHHGSLSREIRETVEQHMKDGKLKAIVATNSLELGIDVGELDQVILLQSPASVAAAIQRAGRSGHRVGETSKAQLIPTHGHDALEAAVLATAITTHDIAPLHPVVCPLDILAQVIVGTLTDGDWTVETLFRAVRTSYAYRTLEREQFDLVMGMLSGRYATSRIGELRPRIAIDGLTGTVQLRRGALTVLRTSGGTIPDRGYFRLRQQGSNAIIGELDEEFVWEARPGQQMAFGTQTWRINTITHNDVMVSQGGDPSASAPFWRGEAVSRDFHFSERVGLFLEEMNRHLDSADLKGKLQADCRLSPAASDLLAGYLTRQRDRTQCDLPHRHHILVEQIDSGPGGTAGGRQIAIHTFWGRRVNRPFALCLEAAWDARFGGELETYASDDAVFLVLEQAIDAAELLSLVAANQVEELLRKSLQNSGFFGARFRECAGAALLLPRGGMRKRIPLWINRLRSQRLLESVQSFGDFPIVLETWRTCLRDHFDMEALHALLGEVQDGMICWSEIHRHAPSPFASTVAWRQINAYMYRDDTPARRDKPGLREDILKTAVFTESLRPTIPRPIVEEFIAKRDCLHPGYVPDSPLELVEWVKERLLIPLPRWKAVLKALEAHVPEEVSDIITQAASRLARITPKGADAGLIAAREDIPRLYASLWDAVTVTDLFGETISPDPLDSPAESDDGAAAIVGQWLQFSRAITPDALSRILGLSPERLQDAIEDLVDARQIVTGALIEGETVETVSDSENVEIMLRMRRARAIPQIQTLSIDHLPLFLAVYQGLNEPTAADHAGDRLDQLVGLPAKAELWETELLPARLNAYDPAILDNAVGENGILWLGHGQGLVRFAFEDDLVLLESPEAGTVDRARHCRELFPDGETRCALPELISSSGLGTRELSDQLWECVWHGQISNDSAAVLRYGIQTAFTAPRALPPDPVVPRNSHPQRHRLRKARRRPPATFTGVHCRTPFSGHWLVVPWEQAEPADLLECEDRNRDRARLVLDRYGIVFRELLANEPAELQWSAVFRSLRLMELAGEIVSGRFFDDVPGPQFASPHAVAMLRSGLPSEAMYWMNATDPASTAGLGLGPRKSRLPSRLPSTHVAFRGATPILLSKRFGRDLTIHVGPDDPDFGRALGPLRNLLERRVSPRSSLEVHHINGVPAAQSEFVPALREYLEVIKDLKHLLLYKRR